VVAVAFAGAASSEEAPAPPKARPIQVVTKAPPDCRALGQVLGAYSKPYGASEAWADADSQVATTAAQRDMLGNAEKQGATHVVMEAVNTARTTYSNTGFATGAAYRCSSPPPR
jgi:hypothetical protein